MLKSFRSNPTREQWRIDVLRLTVISMLLGVLLFGLAQWLFIGTLSQVAYVFFAVILTCTGTLTLLYFERSNGALWFFIISDSIVSSLWGYLEGNPNDFAVIASHIVGILIASLVGKPKHAIFDACFAILLNISLTYLFVNEILSTSEEVLWLSSIEAIIFFVVMLLPLLFASISVETIINGLSENNQKLEREVDARKQAEKAESAQVNWFRNVLDSSPDIFFVFDQQGHLIDINQTGCEKLGYSKEEILGKSIADIDADWDPKRMQEQAERQMRLGESAIILGRNRRKDGSIFSVEIATSLLPDKGQLKRVGFARDISERIAADKSIRDSEKRFRDLYNESPIMMHSVNAAGMIIDVNDFWLSIMEYNRSEVLGSHVSKFFTKESMVQATEIDVPKYFEIGYAKDLSYQMIKKSGEVIETHVTVLNRYDESNKFSHLQATTIDVTEQNRLQNKALQNEKKFRAFFNRSSDITFAIAPDGIILDANERSKLFARGGGQAFVGNKFWLATVFTDFPDAQKKLADMFASASQDGNIHRGEVEVELLSLGKLVLDVILTPIFNESNQLEQIIGEGRDITALVETREALRQSAEDNKILLQEVHHRVKNNLQIITSMLRMQSRSTNDGQIQTSLQEITTRVQSMSLIHQQLYDRRTQLGEIELDLYLRQLLKEINRLYRIDIKQEIDITAIYLDIDRALTCGLIVNELATNAMKYAFPNKTGTLKIIGRRKSEIIHIEVIDDGIGLPAEIGLENATTTGFQLISLMKHQLSGDLSIIRENGTRFILTFPYKDNLSL